MGSLGEFVIESVTQHPCSAAPLVGTLTEYIPGFADTAVYSHRGAADDSCSAVSHGLDVAFHKKAQVFTVELWRRFREEQPKLFDFKDIDCLTVGADNVLPAVLRELGIISVEASIARAIDAKEPFDNQF